MAVEKELINSKHILEAMVMEWMWREVEGRVQQEQVVGRMRITGAEVVGGREKRSRNQFWMY